MKYLLSTLFVLFCTSVVFSQTEQKEVNYFANNAFGNPIVGKLGEHYNGVTYIAYQGEKEDPYVAAYDHKKEMWIGPYKAGTSLLGKTSGKKIDNHGKPTLVVDGEGYIHVVFGGHGGSKEFGENSLGNYNCGKQIHVKTKKPMDISSWEEVDNLTPFATYSQFLKMDNGDIYLFYRHGAHRSDWVYQVSKDNCRTFSPKVSIVKAKPTSATEECSDVWDSWYLDIQHGNGNDIIVSYNYHVCKNMRPHDSERHNCYYMKFDTDKNEWYNVKGESLKLPVTKEYADTMTLVANTGDKWNHIGRACINKNGFPHVGFYEGEDDGSLNGGPKQLKLYQWTGNEWIGGRTNLPEEARGEMNVKSPDSVSCLLGNDKGEFGEVAWWNSSNGNTAFTKEAVLLKEEGGRFTLSNFIRNAHPDAKIVATQKIEGTDYSRIFLLADKGPIMRKKAEADLICVSENQEFDIESVLKKSEKQYAVLLGSAYAENKIPRATDGHDEIEWAQRKMDWTQGFFPGCCWKLYEYTNDAKWKKAADYFQNLFIDGKDVNTTHDLGFMFYCSFGEGYELTKDETYKQVVIDASEALITRYDSTVGCIKSWDFGKERWTFPVIIDNMLNLEMLFEASLLTGDEKYKNVAINHANTTLKNHFRDDYSTWHVVDYNPEDGTVFKKLTHQGYSDESSWARGQGWALYGYTMCYRYTKNPVYLEQAKHVAEFVSANLPVDYVPFWDFNVSDAEIMYKDASAGSLYASAFIELYEYTNNEAYKTLAINILKSLSSEKYFSEYGENCGFLLKHSVGNFPKVSEIDVPINYADYYCLEALLRLKKLNN
ncbi:BNR-4 repeat-containing protein [Draconibacterium sediminis]|nr:BNR-4 repeat-containing protein [Draconibacterium sediminis]